jgi:hypothetical protein
MLLLVRRLDIQYLQRSQYMVNVDMGLVVVVLQLYYPQDM